MNKLTASVTDTPNPLTISVNDSHAAATATALITAPVTGCMIGDFITVAVGYNGNNSQIFEGYVKSVERSAPPDIYTITASNVMIRAVDFFIVSSNPDEPYTWDHISAEDLVGEILGLAGISSYQGSSSSFTFGINNPVEVNLVGAYDFAKMIADLLAWSVFAGPNGVCYFTNRPPFPAGDASVATITVANTTNIKYNVSDRDLRNRVVVYGTEDVYATAQASSPYLPAGFFKSVAYVSQYIDSTAMAQSIASFNLVRLNRLTYNCNITIIGDPSIACRQCVDVVHDFPGITAKWYVFGIEHNWGRTGYTTALQLRR